MTGTIIPFPYNDEHRPDEQRRRVGPPSILMEAQALCDACELYRDAKDVSDRTAAMDRMRRLLVYGSPRVREAASIWCDMVLGPPPALIAIGPPIDRDGGCRVELIGSDYAD